MATSELLILAVAGAAILLLWVSRRRRTADRGPLIQVLEDARKLLSRHGNDFSWSSWNDRREALAEIDDLLSSLRDGQRPDRSVLNALFLPTGPIQEVSLSSGWGGEFLSLSQRFDRALRASDL